MSDSPNDKTIISRKHVGTKAPGRTMALSFFPWPVFAIALALTFALFVWLGSQTWNAYQDVRETAEQVFRLQELKGRIIYLDEVLTMSARMGATTGDVQWEERYRSFEPELDVAIKRAMKLAPETFMSEAAAQTDPANIKLVEMEYHAFDLVRRGNHEAAISLLFSPEYEKQKRIYANGMSRVSVDLQQHVEARLDKYYRRAFLAVASVFIALPILLCVWLAILIKMRKSIIDCRLAEEALRKQQEDLGIILDSVPALIFYKDRENRLIRVNRAFAEAMGLSKEAMEGKTCFELWPEQAEDYWLDDKDVMASGQPKRDIIEPLETKKGKRWVQTDKIPYRDEAGNTIGVIGFALDITERQRAVEALRQLEREKALILSSVSEAVMHLDRDLRILWGNKASAGLANLTVDQMVGRYCYEVLCRRNAPCEGCPVLESMQTSQSEQAELTKYDGSVWDIRAYPIHNECGEVVSAVEIAWEVTDRIRSERELQESEEKFRLAFENAKDAIFWADTETGLIINCNKAAEILLEKRRDEIIGHQQRELHPLQKAEYYVSLFRKHVAGGGPADEEAEVVTKSGKIKDVYITASVTSIGDKKIIQGIFRDITERKRLEEQLRHAQKMEAVGTLAGGIAHDFNNILAGILGYASLVKGSLGEKSPLVHDLERIERLSQRGADLTKAILAFSRKGKYCSEVQSIAGIIESVLKVVEETAGKGIDINAGISDGVSNVVGDLGQLYQVFMNLCLNACESMPGGGILTVKAVDVKLDDEFFNLHAGLRRGPYVSIIISDTGIGMEVETRERIFEPFFTTKADKKGTGLGLAMVIGIVEGHGGCIEVESSPGRGSTFTIYLPATREEVHEAPPTPVETLRGDETILLIDDEVDFRESIGRWLERLGYTVVEAESGNKALRLLEKKKDEIDLVLLDLIMKGMDGAEVFERLTKEVPDLPIVLCTGYSSSAVALRLLREGARDFIQKPFVPRALALKIRKVLDGCRMA